MSEDAFLDLTGVTLVSEDTDEDDEGDVFNILSFKKAIYEVHAHRVWAQMVQWRFLPIFLLIYSVVPHCNCNFTVWYHIAIAFCHLIKRPISASAFSLFIHFHFYRNSSV